VVTGVDRLAKHKVADSTPVTRSREVGLRGGGRLAKDEERRWAERIRSRHVAFLDGPNSSPGTRSRPQLAEMLPHAARCQPRRHRARWGRDAGLLFC
jgi:hypothetical protein